MEQTRKTIGDATACLILGPPLSGKTWIAYKIAKGWKGAVVQPTRDEPPDQFDLSSFAHHPVLLLIDNAQDLTSQFKLDAWRDAFGSEVNVSILVGCRDGPDWEQLQRNCPAIARFFTAKGAQRRVTIAKIPALGPDFSEIKRFAAALGVSGNSFSQKFDGTIGSIILDVEGMRLRYEALRGCDVGDVRGSRLLDSLKLLHTAHLRLAEGSARLVAERVRGDKALSREQWDELRRLTESAGFGFFDEGLFRTYQVYLTDCVLIKPSLDEIYEVAVVASEGGDTSPALNGGIKLLQAGDARAVTLLMKAAELGSVDALSQLCLGLAQERSQFLNALKMTHALIRGGYSRLFETAGILYQRRGKRRWARLAYCAAREAGIDAAEVPLAHLLLDDPTTKEEGRAILRRVIATDTSSHAAFGLAASLMWEIGDEEEAAALWQKSIDFGSPEARLFLAAFYVGWPGHLKKAKALLHDIIDRWQELGLNPAFRVPAYHSLLNAANLSRDEGLHSECTKRLQELGDVSFVDGEIRRLSKSADVLPDYIAPTRNSVAPLASPELGGLVEYSELSSNVALFDRVRYDILEKGWMDVWSPDAGCLPKLRDRFHRLIERGYLQARLISGAVCYRSQEKEQAKRNLNDALDGWPDADFLSIKGIMLLATLETEQGRYENAANLIISAANYYGLSYPHLDQTFPKLAGIATAAWRCDPDSPEQAKRALRHLAVLWVSLEELGPAWWLQAKGRPLFLIRGDKAVEEDMASVAKLSAKQRLFDSREMARILTDLQRNRETSVRIPMPAPQLRVRIAFSNGVLKFKSTWAAFMRISPPQFHLLSIALGKVGIATEWRTNHAPMIELSVSNAPLTVDGVYQPLDLFVRSQIGALEILPIEPLNVEYGLSKDDIQVAFPVAAAPRNTSGTAPSRSSQGHGVDASRTR